MLFAMHWPIKGLGRLEELVSTIASQAERSLLNSLSLGIVKPLEIAHDAEVLVQNVLRVDAAHQGSNRQRQHIRIASSTGTPALETIEPFPPRLFMARGAMPRSANTGSTCF